MLLTFTSAVGACSPVAQRLPQVEAALVGVPRGLMPMVVAGGPDLSPLQPIDDVRGSAGYRREAARLTAHLMSAVIQNLKRSNAFYHTYHAETGAGQGERFLARVQAAIAVPGLGEAVASLLRARTGLVDEIRRMDRELKAISIASPACQALMSIPGVGVQTSAAFAAAVDEAGRFKRSRTAGAYFGLVPRRHQSGELDWTGRITKQGDGTVRKLLYEAANSILTRTRQTFALKTWALKIAKRRGLKKARVALARRLAVIMHAMLRDGTLFEA